MLKFPGDERSMPRVSRFIMTGFWIGLLALSLTRVCLAEEGMASSSVADLVCPHASAAVNPPSSQPATSVSMVGNHMPGDDDLGPLVRTVVREQPLLDPRTIPGFTLGGYHHIAFWGDSHIAGGPFMPTVIQALRARGLSVASSFLPPTMGRANVALPALRAYCIGSGWTADIAYTSTTVRESGPALIDRVADAGADSYLWLDLRNSQRQADVSKVTLVYRATAGATVDYTVDDAQAGSAPLTVSNDSQTLTIRGRGPISTIKLRVARGKVVLHGFMLDYTQRPDVSVDVFGLPSSTVRGWANIDPEYLARSLQGTRYDGVVLEYGTNEGAAPDFHADKYADTLTQALSHVRQLFPDASCVLVGPPDRGVLHSGNERPQPLLMYGRIHQQIEGIQRQVGRRFGCSVWSWQGLMGGPGGSYGWAHAHPSMMGRDLIHLSPDGYRRAGTALAHSLNWGP